MVPSESGTAVSCHWCVRNWHRRFPPNITRTWSSVERVAYTSLHFRGAEESSPLICSICYTNSSLWHSHRADNHPLCISWSIQATSPKTLYPPNPSFTHQNRIKNTPTSISHPPHNQYIHQSLTPPHPHPHPTTPSKTP